MEFNKIYKGEDGEAFKIETNAFTKEYMFQKSMLHYKKLDIILQIKLSLLSKD